MNHAELVREMAERVTRNIPRGDGCLRCLLLVMCTYPFAKKALTLYLARSEGHERYLGCNLMQCKVLASSHQHLIAEAPPTEHRASPRPYRPRAVRFTIALDGRVVHHADDHLVESEYRSVFLKLFPRHANQAHRGATVAGDNLRGTAVVLENTPESLSRHDGASVIRACRQRCNELVAETLVVPFCAIVHYVFGYRRNVTSVYNALKKLVAELSIAHRMVCGCRRLVD